jgi:GNAT superfamily N-acetyltransferase
MTSPVAIPADRLSLAELCALFNRCYADYYVPLRLDLEGYRVMVAICDVELAASRVLRIGDEAIGFANLAARGGRGWIAGMGVAPEARGRGHGRLAMESVLDVARGRGMEAVDLEVLEQNAPAARIYEALGFRDRRLVDVWSRAAGPLPADQGASGRPRAVPAGVAECLACFEALHPVRPPWQCDLATLAHAAERLTAFALRDDGGIAACILVRAAGGAVRIADLAARRPAPPGAFETLLGAVVDAHPGSTMTLLNLPADHAAAPALARLGFVVSLRQREMTLAL